MDVLDSQNNKAPLARPATKTNSGAAVVAQPAPSPNQMEAFQQAVRLFHARKFREARELFLQAKDGSDRGVAHKADLHVRMCDRRLTEPQVVLETPEEHYNYAVTLINTRNLDTAEEHLRSALEHTPEGDHIYYALALCRGLAGDLQGAYENLKRAIDLEPRNRITARQDADFVPLLDQPPLDRLFIQR